MYIFRTEVLANYKDSDKVLKFIEYGEKNPHLLKKCDGSLSLYYKCKGIRSIDGRIAKRGERSEIWQCSYKGAKMTIRHAVRKIKELEKLYESDFS